MEKQNRELTGGEKRRIRKLVTSLCANYDKEYSCLPLDSECYTIEKLPWKLFDGMGIAPATPIFFLRKRNKNKG